MNGNLLVTDFFMEIKKNLPRFLSVLLIVALGVAFFSGIKATKPDMQKTAEAYYDDSNLMDLRIVSALGLTGEDLLAVQSVEGVERAVGVYSADVLCEDGETERVLRLRSYTPEMNQITVTEGRIPELPGECLLDMQVADTMGLKIGDVVTVKSGTSDDISETLGETGFIIVGIGNSPLYLWRERDTTTIGNGSVSGFMIVLPEIFKTEVYSEIDLTVSGARDLNSFQSKYEKTVDQVAERIEEIQEPHAKKRYDEVYETAQAEVSEAEAELAAAKKELDDAKAALDAAQAEVDAAKAEINENLQEILSGQTTVEEQERSIQSSEASLTAAKAALDATNAEIVEKEASLTAARQQLSNSQTQLLASWSQWSEQSAQLSAQQEQLATQQEQLAAQEAQLNEKRQQINDMYARLEELQFSMNDSMGSFDTNAQEQTDGQETTGPDEQAALLEEQIAQAETELAQAEADFAQAQSEVQTLSDNLDAAQAELNNTWTELDNIGRQLESENAQLTANETSFAAVKAQFELSQAQYNQQKATLDAARTALEAAKTAIANGQTSINSSQNEVSEAEAQLEQGKSDYEKQYAQSSQKLNDATAELNNKKRMLLKMDVPDWNILDRGYLQSAESFKQDADRIGAIGNVFPVVFYLIAALVSLTAITRMVDEQRTEIGTLKALGYEKHQIAEKYICYALLASVIGGLFGIILGQTIIPRVIIHAYRILYYALPETKAPLHPGYSLLAILLAAACTALAALAACYRRLTDMPAQLMRPEAPKNGKRVFLEKWTALWSHLNFSQKATVRNLIRYKKRFLMTVFGIAACTALLLVGFGLKNSTTAIAEKQYEEILTYDAELMLTDTSVESMTELGDTVALDKNVKNYMYVYKTSMDAGCGSTEKAAYLTVVDDQENFGNFVSLHTRRGGKTLEIPETGVIISEKLAKLIGADTGDVIYLKDNENYRVEVEVAGIAENYYRHYVYMSETQYAALYGGEPVYNELLTVNTDNSDSFEDEMGQKYLALDAVGTISYNSGMERTIKDMLKNMNVIIVVLIVSAGLLAFIVLYNLNHINITERRRELASLRVLGFYDREVTAYVLRENVVLTLIGIVLGLLFGIGLHYFVIITAELDVLMFGRHIKWTSYVFAVLLTMAFSACVNVIMHFSLKKIDMVESLKSVE